MIDLGSLCSSDVTVQIAVEGSPFELGDTVTMTWIGTPLAGEPLTHSQSVILDNIPWIYETTVPNAQIRAIVQGVGQASYVLTKANGDPPQSSKLRLAGVSGDSPLQVPIILELIGDVLDPKTERAHVEIPVYDGMTNGDLIDLIWLGTRANGLPYLYEAQHIVTGSEAGSVVYIPVMSEHIALLENGTLEVSYRVSNDAWQTLEVRVSEHLKVEVGQRYAELPVPIIIEAPDGVLDPEVYPGSVTLKVDYSGTVAGDILTWHWIGQSYEGTGSDWIPITTTIAGCPVTFTIPRTLIEPNINDEVKVLYTVKLGTTGQYQYSAVLNLVIGKLIGDLPPPNVLKAPDGTLDPLDALTGTTVRTSYDSMDPMDLITMVWLGGAGAGSPDDQQKPGSTSGEIEFAVPATVIGANIGRGVTILYRVQRYTAQKQSETLCLTVLPFSDPDKDLPHPVIAQADNQTRVFNLATFIGNATATVGKWPFSAQGQRVWLRLEGDTSSGGPHTIVLLDGIALTSTQADTGLSEDILRTALEQFGQDTTLTVICNVAFDGIAYEGDALPFPRAVYTFKLHHDWVSPVIVSVKDANGEVANGGTTFNTALSLSGTGTIEAELEILDDTTRLTTTRSNSTGNWTVNLSALVAKNYSLTAKALDGSGLISQPRTFEVLENMTPTLEQVLDSSGPLSNGGTTVDTTVSVSGKASPDLQIELFDGSVSKGKASTDATGAWTLSVSALTVASHLLKAKALYGTGPESAVWTVIVATAIAPTIASIKDSKNVEIPAAGFTTDTSVTLSGGANANLEVEIFDGTRSLGTVKVNAAGQWTLPINGLTLAAHTVKAKALYGSEAESAVRGFTVTAVVVPSIVTVKDPRGNAIAEGSSTYASDVTVSGKASINQQVELFDSTTSKGTISADSSGNWTRQASGLGTGNHSLTAKALYANNPVSAAWSFNVLAATVPTLASVRDSKGEVGNGGQTTDTAVTAAGKAAASQQVQVLDGETSKGDALVNASGDWSRQVTGLALGSHSLKAVAQYGDEPSSNKRSFTVVSPIPPFMLDTSTVSLNGHMYGLIGHPGRDPLSWPAGTRYQRTPTSGVPPYTYSSSNSSTVIIKNDGWIYSVTNGTSTITVTDSAGRSASYTVIVSNVTMVVGLGNGTFKQAEKLAQSQGRLIPSLDVLRGIYSQWGVNFPMGNRHYWSSTAAPGLWRNYVKNLVHGEELIFPTKYENAGSFANIVAI